MKKLLFLLLFTGFAYAQPAIGTPNDLTVCDDNFDGFAQFDLTVNDEVLLDGLSPANYSVTYHETAASAELGGVAIDNTISYNSMSATIYARVTQISTPANYATAAFNLIVNPRPAHSALSNIVVFDTDGTANNSTAVNLNSYIGAMLGDTPPAGLAVTFHALESAAMSGTSPIASPYITGTTTIYYRITITLTSCFTMGHFDIAVLPEDYVTPKPTGTATQTFSAGDKLSDLEVTGQNIQWYETAAGDTPLSMETVLVNNTTYHAAQTVYNIESEERLPVTVSLVLGTQEQTFTALQCYPNPAKDLLTLANNIEIDIVTISNLLGQTMITKQLNSRESQLDLSSLSNGVYFVKVSAGGKNRTVKIIKE